MKHAKCDGLLDAVLDESIPMYGRMIHGQGQDGKLYQESQAYDAKGRVRELLVQPQLKHNTNLA